MYEYIKGTLTQIHDQEVVIECCNIGYRMKVPHKSIEALYSLLHKEVKLYTALIVKEDSHTLVGFTTVKERELFFILQKISGVGTKTAIQILSSLDPSALSSAVFTKNTSTLTSIPGIGKKSAERLIMELKDKLPKVETSPGATDAIQALVKLGYSAPQAQKVLQKIVIKEKGLDQIIKEALMLI